MDIEELRATIYEARKDFLSGKYTLTEEKPSLVHITQVLTYVDLSVKDYLDLIDERVKAFLQGETEDCDDVVAMGIAKVSDGVCIPKNSLVLEAARRKGVELPKIRENPRNEAILDLSYALDSLRIPNVIRIVDDELFLEVKRQKIYPVTIGIVQPEKAYHRSGDDVLKLWLYVPRFLSGSLGRKLLPIIIDLGLAEALKNVPIIYLPLGILSLLAFYKRNMPAVSIYTPVYKKIESIIG